MQQRKSVQQRYPVSETTSGGGSFGGGGGELSTCSSHSSSRTSNKPLHQQQQQQQQQQHRSSSPPTSRAAASASIPLLGLPSMALLRIALVLPLITLSVILTAGFTRMPSHDVATANAKLAANAKLSPPTHSLHSVILQHAQISPQQMLHRMQEHQQQQQQQQQNPVQHMQQQQQQQQPEFNGNSENIKPKTTSTTTSDSIIPSSIQSNIVRFTPLISSDLPTTTKNNENEQHHVQYHLIFSTGCSNNQDWQSYLFFYHAWKSGQPGHVTRIVSGCPTTTIFKTDSNKNRPSQQQVQEFFDAQISPMSPGQFHIHFTPDFSDIKAPNITNYKYFNKPFGTLHWMEHVLGYKTNLQTHEQFDNPANDHTIVVLLDPDQLLLRPFVANDFSQDEWKFLPKSETARTVIRHGQPMGQLYGFGMQWKDKVTMDHVARFDLPSPVDSISRQEGQQHYIVGPPYIATARDMYAIAKQWSIFVPRVHDQYPHLLAEMFAYCLAACHLKLPHQIARSFMISSVGTGPGEGWNRIDDLPDACLNNNPAATSAAVPSSSESLPNSKNHASSSPIILPRVFHFCQFYSWGPYSFGKNHFPPNFLSCESPLLAEPPHNVLEKYNQSFGSVNRQDRQQGEKPNPRYPKRQAFSVCTLIPAINQAAIYFKQQNCQHNPNTNFSKILVAMTNHGLGSNYITY